jgi:hypothetical protein
MMAQKKKDYAASVAKEKADNKAAKIEAARMAALTAPVKTYDFIVPDSAYLPFPAIGTIRPEDRQELQSVQSMLEEKRLKELKNNPTFKSFESDLNLDEVISDKFEELEIGLEKIKTDFMGLNGNEMLRIARSTKKRKQPENNVDVRQVVKSRALQVKDFELFEKAPLMDEKDAIEKLR